VFSCPNILGRRKIVDDIQAKWLIAHLLERYTPGSILHLLAQVLREQARFLPHDHVAEERLRNAEAALYVFAAGLDSVCVQ